MARKSRRSGRRGNSTFGKALKWAGILGAPIVALGGGGFALLSFSSTETIDANFCFPRDDQPELAVMIDNSMQGQTEFQYRDYGTGMMRVIDTAQPNTRVMFFTTELGAQGSIAEPVFTICKPAQTAAERAAIGAPEKPKQFLDRQFKEARERYNRAVKDVIAATKDDDRRAKDSPILELIAAASKYPGFQGANRKAVLLTDGYQNSEAAEFCVKKNHMPAVKTHMQRPAYFRTKPKALTGVDFTLLMVEPSVLWPALQLPFCREGEVLRWWPNYLKAVGAASVDLTILRAGVGS